MRSIERKLRLTSRQHAELKAHLFPGDGKESAAIALCGRRAGEHGHALLVQRVLPVPHEICERSVVNVSWPTTWLLPALNEAAKRQLAIVKFHSHTSAFRAFSTVDDRSDRTLFPAIFGAAGRADPHASVVMVPDGSLVGRFVDDAGGFKAMDLLEVVGDDIAVWSPGEGDEEGVPESAIRHAQLFGARTTRLLRRLSAAVVGCSGTGSPVVEQLARLGIGRLVLVDPDVVEDKNLNRILNATLEDVRHRRPKVEVLATAISRMGLDTEVHPLAANLLTREAVEAVAGCDVVFGCMDGAEGRLMLNRLCTFYSLPYFDLGLSLRGDGHGGIDIACGGVHYLKPGGTTLVERGVITEEQARAEGLRRTNPAEFHEQQKRGYLADVGVDRPGVISFNMQVGALAVSEFLSRLHPYRLEENAAFASLRFDWMSGPRVFHERDRDEDGKLSKHVGRGDVEPLLDSPYLSV